MNVLDIDLDFFLSEITWLPQPSDGDRQDDNILPWAEFEVHRFLQEQCGLSTENRNPGKNFTRHDEAFWCWKKLIEDGRLTSPFNLVHVDAHADMGLGLNANWKYICTKVLARDVGDRTTDVKVDQVNGLNEGSFLVFAIACRWISQLTYVHHPTLNLKLGDVPPVHMLNFDEEAPAIQLKRYLPNTLHSVHGARDSPVFAYEPEVPFERIKCSLYHAETKFDYVFFTHSPQYTPISVDPLVTVVSEYINPI